MKKELTLIGIGSSAGGLEALQSFFSKVKKLDNVSYIVAQHLSPTHKSMMCELLARVSGISVQEAKNGLLIKEKTIYVTPENTDIYVKDKKIFLKSINHIFGPKPSVNYLFSSIAEEYQHKAIGIILSGTGSDGAFGIRAIKSEGGITIAQSPETSKYDGMPFSAINTGKVDLVIPISELADEIEKIVNNLGKNIENSINKNFMQTIFKLLFDESGVDFSLYKKNTITRRIARRIQALKIEDLESYVTFITKNPTEINNLYQDILIGVTSFFRDKEVFEDIKETIAKICEKKEQGEEIRFWSVGCSTGEEAYSLAMLISEILKDKVDKYKIKIFATDIDEESLKIARSGIYSETSLLNINKDYVHKYFNILKNQYEVKKNIREMVVFSKHNIVSDSPFLRVDLITCRNMLIYFDTTLQQRVFPIFHYALKDNGYLVLGKSETVAEFNDLFLTINKNNKVYKSQYTGLKEAPKLYNYNGFKTLNEQTKKYDKKRADEEILEETIVNSLYDSVLNQCVVVNTSNEIVYNKGNIPYLKLSQGKITHNIFKLINEDLILDLRTAFNEVNKTNKFQTIKFREVTIFDDIKKYVRLIVVPVVSTRDGEEFKIVFFETEDKSNLHLNGFDEVNSSEDILIEKLKEELEVNKIHLQNVIEELETSYEETQSLNEELQSSNEELETTNEELQSTNEELQTAYSELKVLYDDKEIRTQVLEDLTEKLKSKTQDYKREKELSETIVNSVPVSIIFVDEKCIITFVNENAKKLLNVSNKSILNRTFDNRSWELSDFDGNKIKDEDLPFSFIKKTFEPVNNFLLILTTNTKQSFYLKINGSPLFDSEGKFKGAVFSLEDITQITTNSKTLKDYENKILKENQNKDLLLNAISSIKTYSSVTKNTNPNIDSIKYILSSLNIDFRNNLNEVFLLLNRLANKSNQKYIQNINDNLTLLMNKVGFYEDYFNINSENSINLIEMIKESFDLFKNLLNEHNIEINDKLISLEFYANQNLTKKLLLLIFDYLIEINKKTSKELEVNIFNTKDEIVFELLIHNLENFDETLYKSAILDDISTIIELMEFDFNTEVSSSFKIKINKNANK